MCNLNVCVFSIRYNYVAEFVLISLSFDGSLYPIKGNSPNIKFRKRGLLTEHSHDIFGDFGVRKSAEIFGQIWLNSGFKRVIFWMYHGGQFGLSLVGE